MVTSDLEAARARLAELEGELASAREARRRSEALSLLLPTVADALDVREVFARISEVVQPVLPHDMMVLAFLEEGRRKTAVFARSLRTPFEVDGLPMLESLRDHLQADALVKSSETVPHDGALLGVDVIFHGEFPPEAPDGEWEPVSAVVDDVRKQLWLTHGYQTAVRVKLFRKAEKIGALYFASKTPGAYDRGTLEVARRIADHVSLALAHKDLAEAAEHAAEARGRAERLEERVRTLLQDADQQSGQIVGISPRWKHVLKQAARVAATDTTVLLVGESGTGKEVVARFLHRASPRAGGPLVALNCAALPEQLLESELFGHERGAFSGAIATRIGRVEQAARGVLFLDEVGEMSPAVQAKLLRVLEQREFQRLGSGKTLKADVRVIAATNRNLLEAVAKGAFREDLYYRLHVFEIALPPLRDRPDDILPLAEAFLDAFGRGMGEHPAGISQEARDVLLRQGWPGNVRELRNVMERAAILCEGGLVTSEHLPFAEVSRAAPPPGELHVDTVEKGLIESALERAKGNKSLAARLLGLTRGQLYARMEKHALKV